MQAVSRPPSTAAPLLGRCAGLRTHQATVSRYLNCLPLLPIIRLFNVELKNHRLSISKRNDAETEVLESRMGRVLSAQLALDEAMDRGLEDLVVNHRPRAGELLAH